MPGLLALTPPRKTARGRERDDFIVYLMLSGNASFSKAEFMQLTNEAAGAFYQSPGPLTSAMRKAADQINSKLLERNRTTTGRGQYALGLLVLAVIRENQCTLLLSGPTHAVWVSDGQSRHIYEPALSGKGLGSSQSASTYLSQIELHPQDLLVLCGIFPRDWEADLLNERPPASLDASYRKLSFTKGDLNAVLIQAQNGHGIITILRPEVNAARSVASQPNTAPVISSKEEPGAADSQGNEQQADLSAVEFPAEPLKEGPVFDSQFPPIEARDLPVKSGADMTDEKLDALADFAAHIIQPSAYAIPPQSGTAIPLPKDELPETADGGRGFPSSIPRARPAEPKSLPEEIPVEETSPETPVEPAPQPGRARRRRNRPIAGAAATRQVAKALVRGIQSGRRVNERLG